MDEDGGESCNEVIKDRISELHNSLKVNILERLPLFDAVGTNLLSKKWSHAWTKMGQLVFDEKFFDDNFPGLTSQNFCRIIERILLHHEGPVTKFVLDIPQHYRSSVTINANGIFIALARKGVQKLELNNNLSHGGVNFHVSSYFFQCGGLTHLVLSINKLQPPADFQGFSNLVSLDLNLVGISWCKLTMLISRCPLLERLSLAWLVGNLYEPLHIVAPNLRIFHFKEHIAYMFVLKNSTKLTAVSLRWSELEAGQRRRTYFSVKFLCSLSKIEDFHFDLPLLESFVGDCPGHLDNEFAALSILTLGYVNIRSQNNILFVFCLLRSSPNLKTLNLHMHPSPNSETEEEDAKCLQADGSKENTFNNLLNVKIDGIAGLRCEVMLVKTMLSSCPFLETLVIEPSENISIEASHEIAWEINRCRRPSALVEVVYTKPCS